VDSDAGRNHQTCPPTPGSCPQQPRQSLPAALTAGAAAPPYYNPLLERHNNSRRAPGSLGRAKTADVLFERSPHTFVVRSYIVTAGDYRRRGSTHLCTNTTSGATNQHLTPLDRYLLVSTSLNLYHAYLPTPSMPSQILTRMAPTCTTAASGKAAPPAGFCPSVAMPAWSRLPECPSTKTLKTPRPTRSPAIHGHGSDDGYMSNLHHLGQRFHRGWNSLRRPPRCTITSNTSSPACAQNPGLFMGVSSYYTGQQHVMQMTPRAFSPGSRSADIPCPLGKFGSSLGGHDIRAPALRRRVGGAQVRKRLHPD